MVCVSAVVSGGRFILEAVHLVLRPVPRAHPPGARRVGDRMVPKGAADRYALIVRCVMMRARPFRQENAMSEFLECLRIVTANRRDREQSRDHAYRTHARGSERLSGGIALVARRFTIPKFNGSPRPSGASENVGIVPA